jgi:cell wall-associated NlpC family hydrolase
MEPGDEGIQMKPLSSREKAAVMMIGLVLMTNIGAAQATESDPSVQDKWNAIVESNNKTGQASVKEQQQAIDRQLAQAQETELRLQIVAEALTHVGQVPYVLTGSTPRGWDCSGFTRYVFAKFDINLEHSAGKQSRTGTWTGVPQPGDLVSFERGNGIEHIGIYVGDGVIVESTVETYTTRVVKLEDAYPDRLGWNIRFNSVIGSGLF